MDSLRPACTQLKGWSRRRLVELSGTCLAMTSRPTTDCPSDISRQHDQACLDTTLIFSQNAASRSVHHVSSRVALLSSLSCVQSHEVTFTTIKCFPTTPRSSSCSVPTTVTALYTLTKDWPMYAAPRADSDMRGSVIDRHNLASTLTVQAVYSSMRHRVQVPLQSIPLSLGERSKGLSNHLDVPDTPRRGLLQSGLTPLEPSIFLQFFS